MTRMEIRLLGPLDALDGGRPLALGAPRSRALLAVLALSPGRVVPSSRLIDDLWGEVIPGSAAKMVQIHVSQLRKALPAGVLVTRSPGYLIDLPAEAVDLGRAEAGIAAGRAALAAGDPGRAAELLGAALALWRGPALTEFPEPFAAGEARRIEELRLAATEDRIAADLALGRHPDVVAEVTALIERNPLRERLRELAMLALYRSGRQAEALAAYRDARRTLGDELGIEPSEALRELERRILRQDPALTLRAPSPAGGPAPGVRPRRSSPVVGRLTEAGSLDAHLGRALAGERQVVVLSGEAGAGKTTLVEAFLAGPGAVAARVGRGQCVEQHGAPEPYMPVLQMLGDLCRGPGGEEVVEVLAGWAPTWLVQMPWLVGEDDHARLRERVVGATPQRMLREAVEAVHELAARRPLVMVLEDLHWSDPSSLDLVGALARRHDPAPLLAVLTVRSADATTREHPVHALVREMVPRGLASEIALPALGEDDVRDYLAARLPGVSLPRDVSRTLRERTAGNPLFLEKAVDAWIEQRTVREEAGAWRLEADPGELAWTVPSSVRQLIRQRLLTLAEPDRRLLEAGSVAAPEFAAALVADACGMPDEEAEERCRAMAADAVFLVARGPEVWPDGTVSERFGFSHALCHEVLYEDLPAGRRARLHAAVGGRLERAHGTRADAVAAVLAAHFERGGDAARAVRHLRTAAAQALVRLAPREAIDFATSGLRLLETLADDPGEERLRIELDLYTACGPAMVATRGWASAETERAFVRAGELAERLGLEDQVAWSAYRLATLYEIRGEYDRSERILGQTLEDAERAPGEPALADSYELLACSLFHQGAFERALRSAETGLALSDGIDVNTFTAAYGDNPAISCHSWAALSLWFLGRPDEARVRAERAVALARGRPYQHGLTIALGQAAVVAHCRREPADALSWADECRASAEREGFVYRIAMGAIIGGWATAALGDPTRGVEGVRRGLEMSRATGATMDDAYYLGLLADALIRAGDRDGAARTVAEALAVVPRDGRFFWDPELHRLRGSLLHAAGDRDGAERALRHAIAVARDQGGRALELRAALSLAALLRDEGRETEGREVVATVHAGFTEGHATPDLRDAAALLAALTPAPGRA